VTGTFTNVVPFYQFIVPKIEREKTPIGCNLDEMAVALMWDSLLIL